MTSTIHPSDLLSAAKEHDEYLLALDEAKQWWSAEDKLTAVLTGLDDGTDTQANLDQAERWKRAEAMFDAQIIVGLRAYLVAEGRALPLPKPKPARTAESKPSVPDTPQTPRPAAVAPVQPETASSTSPSSVPPRAPIMPPVPVGHLTPSARPKPDPAPAGTAAVAASAKSDPAVEKPDETDATPISAWRKRRKKKRDTPVADEPTSAKNDTPPPASPSSQLAAPSRPTASAPAARPVQPPSSAGPVRPSTPSTQPTRTGATFSGHIAAGRPGPSFDRPHARAPQPTTKPANGAGKPPTPRQPILAPSIGKTAPSIGSPPKQPAATVTAPPSGAAIAPSTVTAPPSAGQVKGVRTFTGPERPTAKVSETRAPGGKDQSKQDRPGTEVLGESSDPAKARTTQKRKGNFLIGAGAVLLFVSLLGALFLRTSGTSDVTDAAETTETDLAVAASSAADPVAAIDDGATQISEATAAAPAAVGAPFVTFTNCGPDRATGFVENPLATAVTTDIMIEFSDGTGQFNPVTLQLDVPAGETTTIDVPISGLSSDASKLQCMAFVRQFVEAS